MKAFFACVLAVLVLALAFGAQAADKLVFGTNWKAEAEHGGFYQAKADGTYAKYGLDVEIRQGGPLVNHAQLLAVGAVDAAMIGNTIFDNEENTQLAIVAEVELDAGKPQFFTEDFREFIEANLDLELFLALVFARLALTGPPGRQGSFSQRLVSEHRLEVETRLRRAQLFAIGGCHRGNLIIPRFRQRPVMRT